MSDTKPKRARWNGTIDADTLEKAKAKAAIEQRPTGHLKATPRAKGGVPLGYVIDRKLKEYVEE